MFCEGKISAIFRLKCPKCHVGELYEDPNPYNLSKLGNMHKTCPKCGQRYTLEPGFYFGAAFMTYFINLLILAISFLAYWIPSDPFNVYHCMAVMIISAIVLGPYNFAISRSLWIHFFVKYDSEAIKKFQKILR